MVNSMGPRTDPCGTPYFNSWGSDVHVLMWTFWVRPVEYDRSHSKTFPWNPNDDSNEVDGDGQSCQMPHWGRGEPVLPFHECRMPVGGHSEHITGLSQCFAVDDMLIDILHTDRLFLDDRQAAHIQCALQVWIGGKDQKPVESSLRFHSYVSPSLGVIKWRLFSVLGRNQQIPDKCGQWAWVQVLTHLNKAQEWMSG